MTEGGNENEERNEKDSGNIDDGNDSVYIISSRICGGDDNCRSADSRNRTDYGYGGCYKALGAAIAVGLAAAAGAVGMGIAIAKSSEGIARQPEAEGKIRTNLMLGLVFIETAIIYALIVAILIIFVL